MVRKIIEINQELCNGCGACANACHEGAIVMIDGKAKLVKEDYCDGLGDCLPACPTNAISMVEREAAEYDETAVKERMRNAENQGTEKQTAENQGTEMQNTKIQPPARDSSSALQLGNQPAFQGCPGTRARMLRQNETANPQTNPQEDPQVSPLLQPKHRVPSYLQQWPVQIKLMPLKAPYYENANLLIAADCTAYAYANFHEDFIRNHVTIVGCPKLDDMDYSEKLTEIISHNNIKSVKIVRMEVPCCGGLQQAAITALQNSGKMIPWQVVTLSVDGKILE